MSDMSPAAIAIDIGGTAIKFGLTNLRGDILWESITPTPNSSGTAIVETLLRCIREVRLASERHGASCIGIGTPGIVDVSTGFVVGGALQLPGWENLPLAAIITRETGLPAFVDNDANLMGLGEYVFGKNSRAKNTLFFTLGTGIGGAIFINGELYRGSRNAGGELGYIPFHYDGKDGHWEDFASMKGLVRRYLLRTGEKDSGLSAKSIFEKAAAGEKTAREAIEENIYLVGLGMAGYINIFNPDQIIIGGGVSETQSDYIARIKEEAFRLALPECCKGVEIVAASLGNRAGFIGAGYYALSRK